MFEFCLVLSFSYAIVVPVVAIWHWLADADHELRSLSWSFLVGLVWPYSLWWWYRHVKPRDEV